MFVPLIFWSYPVSFPYFYMFVILILICHQSYWFNTSVISLFLYSLFFIRALPWKLMYFLLNLHQELTFILLLPMQEMVRARRRRTMGQILKIRMRMKTWMKVRKMMRWTSYCPSWKMKCRVLFGIFEASLAHKRNSVPISIVKLYRVLIVERKYPWHCCL